MAGNYMNAPADRLAYDLDGSLGAYITATGQIQQMTGSSLAALNGENESLSTLIQSTSWALAVIFPISIDLTAAFFSMGFSTSGYVWQTSKNTTNGVDGTWTTQGSPISPSLQVKPNYRVQSNLFTFPGGTANTGVRGVRLAYTATPTQQTWVPKALHLYGTPSANATTDRLAFWHPTSNQKISPSYFDFGNTPRGSSQDINFRIKNLSSGLTANDIDVYVDAPTPGAPSVASFLTFSTDNKTSFSPSFTIEDLAPGEVSPVYTLRRVTPNAAQISVWSARINTQPQSWSQ
jgi:hypothetical protein